MIISKNTDNGYYVKIKDSNIDIFDYDEVLELVNKVIKKIMDEDYFNGLYRFDIYVNFNYGMIMDIKKIEDGDSEVEISVGFHIDSVMLEKVDYFYLKDIGVKNKYIYYWDGDFFIMYDNYEKEDTEIIYGEEALEIINKGIKLKI